MTPEEAAAAAAAQQASAQWLAANRPDMVQQQNSAEQAAAQNAAYMNNTAPRLPYYSLWGAPQYADYSGLSQSERERYYQQEGSNLTMVYNKQGQREYLTRQEYTQQFGATPEQREYAKHEKAWSEPRNDLFLSPEAARITAEYNRQHGNIVTGGGSYRQGEMEQYDPSGFVGFSGRAAVYAASWQPLEHSKIYGQESTIERISTVPTRDPHSAAQDIGASGSYETWNGRTFYVPYGSRTQQELLDTKAVYDPIGGRVGFYQVPRSIYESEGGFKRRYGMEIASGSTGALQSGMFSMGKALTPDIRKQWAPEEYAESANISKATRIRAMPETYSRMGAEAYGGVVTKMYGKTLAPGTEMGRYAPETGNMANLVDPYGVNRPKSQLQATEPWKIDYNSPSLQTMEGSGFYGTRLSPTGAGEYAKVGTVEDRYFARQATVPAEEKIQSPSSLPKPFLSTPSKVTIENPKGEIFGTYVPGISEGVAFFEPKSRVVETEQRTPMAPVTTFGEPYTENGVTYYPQTTKSGDIVTTTKQVTPIAGSSGFDVFESNIRKFLPESKVGEEGLEIASSVNPLSTNFAPIRAGKEITFGVADLIGIDTKQARQANADVVASTDVTKGQYQSFYEHPTLTVGSFAAGAAFGTLFKGAGVVGGAVRSRIAPAAISRGQTPRAVLQYGEGAWKVAQVGMAGLYAADLSGRATKGFTEFNPAVVAPRARAMAVQEVYPMTVGFGMPDRVVKATRVSEIGYQQALMAGRGEPGLRMGEGAKPIWGVSEPSTTGRFDWYIKQPVTRVASKPIELVKQDYRAFLQEAGSTSPVVRIQKPGFTDYVGSKLNMGEYGKPITPETNTLNIPQKYAVRQTGLEPISTEFGPEVAQKAYGKNKDIFTLVGEKLGAGQTPKPEFPTLRTSDSLVYSQGKWSKVSREPVGEVSPDLSMKAYGKQELFNEPVKPEFSREPVAPENEYAFSYGPKEPISNKVKAYFQENPVTFIENLRISARYPAMDIANINRASAVRLGDIFGNQPRYKGKTSLNIFGTPTTQFVRKTPYPEYKPTETISGNGQVSVSRMEPVSTSSPSMQAPEQFRGMPMYPSGPSPVQKQRSYVIEEEEQYYRLPPGMKSPGPKQETIFVSLQTPMSKSGLSTTTDIKPASVQDQMQESRPRFDQMQRTRQDSKLEPAFSFTRGQGKYPSYDLRTRPNQDFRTIIEPRFDIGQRFEQRTTTIPRQDTRLTPRITQITEITRRPPPDIPPEVPKIPFGGGLLPGGGGGYRPLGNLYATSWRRNNLVADQPYLARGMKSINLGETLFNDFRESRPRRKTRRKKK